MLEQIQQAIKLKDYQLAHKLLQELKYQEPENPWIELYKAIIQEETGESYQAEASYRQILLNCDNYKIMSKARQGLERLEEKQKASNPPLKLLPIKQACSPQELGVLILEPVNPESKKTAAIELAKIMQLDNYTANTQLPTRSWRLYRTGDIEDLKTYEFYLKNASIPCFSNSVKEINEINVYQVNFFQFTKPQVTIYCQDENESVGKLTFDWSEVKNRVDGLIPIFEEITEKNLKGKERKKTKVLDYAQFCDLHLPSRKSILRICAQNYQFKEGINFGFDPDSNNNSPHTLKENWEKLNSFLDEYISSVKRWSEFDKFANIALDFPLMLQHIKPKLNIFRIKPSSWDAGFHLYSALVFLNHCE